MKRILMVAICIVMLAGMAQAKEKALLKEINLPTGATARCWQTVRTEVTWIVRGENRGKIEQVQVVMYGWINETAYITDKEPITTMIKIYDTAEEIESWKNECNKLDKEAKKYMKETPTEDLYGATDSETEQRTVNMQAYRLNIKERRLSYGRLQAENKA